jgi:hypothetical protein
MASSGLVGGGTSGAEPGRPATPRRQRPTTRTARTTTLWSCSNLTALYERGSSQPNRQRFSGSPGGVGYRDEGGVRQHELGRPHRQGCAGAVACEQMEQKREDHEEQAGQGTESCQPDGPGLGRRELLPRHLEAAEQPERVAVVRRGLCLRIGDPVRAVETRVRVGGQDLVEEVVPRRELGAPDRVAVTERLEPPAELVERTAARAALPESPVETGVDSPVRPLLDLAPNARGTPRSSSHLWPVMEDWRCRLMFRARC